MKPSNPQTYVTFNDGTTMPQLGFGTWKLSGTEARDAVREAINVGYRHIDTAAIYGNEKEVGDAIAEAIADGDVTRDELFITTKVWNDHHGRAAAEDSYRQSMDKLGLEYVDLLLVHWPCPAKKLYTETFAALGNLMGFGTVQCVGVSNFYPEVLDEIISATGITPVLNQVELHPGFSQQELRRAHADRGIITESWSPLGRGDVLGNDTIGRIAQEVGATPAQVVLRWHLQLGCSVIPKSADPQRMRENFEVFGFELTEQQVAEITALDGQESMGRRGPDPAVFGNDS